MGNCFRNSRHQFAHGRKILFGNILFQQFAGGGRHRFFEPWPLRLALVKRVQQDQGVFILAIALPVPGFRVQKVGDRVVQAHALRILVPQETEIIEGFVEFPGHDEFLGLSQHGLVEELHLQNVLPLDVVFLVRIVEAADAQLVGRLGRGGNLSARQIQGQYLQMGLRGIVENEDVVGLLLVEAARRGGLFFPLLLSQGDDRWPAPSGR